MYTMLRRLAEGASLQQCRVNDIQRKQRSKLTVGLGMAVIIFILLCTVACGGSDGSLAKSGLNIVVVSGQARIQSGGENTPVVEGQEAVITAGDQIVADEAGVKLLLADGSLLHLNPGTLEVVTFSAEGTARLSLKGRLEVEAASPLLTVEITVFVYESLQTKTTQFTATPTLTDTTFQLWIDGINNTHLTVEAGKVNVTSNGRTETIPAGGEVKAVAGEPLEVILPQTETPVEPRATAVATADRVPAITPDLIHPSPTATATATVAPTYLYPAPGLVGPADGSEFNRNETILLIWDTPTSLLEDEWYEVQLWKEGEESPKVVQWVREGTWKVELRYYPGRYQWRIRIVRVQEGSKGMDLSPPSQTWSFGWLSPPVPVPTAPTSPPVSAAPVSTEPVDLTVYLWGTNGQRFATFPGEEHVNAGTIYAEGRYVYGNVAVQIGDTVYHSDEELASGGPKLLPAPYRLEVKFSESLVSATEEGKEEAGFDPQKAQFWVGTLNCNSATPTDKPYEIEVILYAGEQAKKHTEVSFFAANDPLCGAGGEEEGGGGGEKRPVRPTSVP
jgi:hypothetical protein